MKMTAGNSLVKVLESWNVKHIYGIVGSSVNGLMEALYEERESINYIQVRHEAAGAMAAVGHAKTTGEIGVCFGSAAPGGTNLFNGLYDAKMDRVPMLAIVGQTASGNINTNFFQEMDEIPIYSDVSVFNKMVTTSKQIPHVIDEAIRTAYAQNGVSVVIIPNNLAEEEINFTLGREKKIPPVKRHFPIDEDDVESVLSMIRESKRPVFYGGLGLKGARDVVEKFSEQFSMPIVTSAISIGVAASSNHKNFMGAFGRLGTKSAYDVIQDADLILFVGSNHPFVRAWPTEAKIIQINNRIEDIAKQSPVEMGIVADGEEFITRLIESGIKRDETDFLKAARISKANWDRYLNEVATDESKGLSAEAVIKTIGDYSTTDAYYGLDVGNNTMYSVRMLPLNQKRQYSVSGIFATLGVGLPYSISAKLASPKRQVWSISGDGGVAMNIQEIITQSRYELPIINVILSNQTYGFIKHAQLNSEFLYGVDITDVDWAMTTKGMGAISFRVETIDELYSCMEEIKTLQSKGNKKPIVIDARVYYSDPVDTSLVMLDPKKFSREEIEKYKERYEFYNQPSLSEIIETLK
ncbi:pyruvate oxidase [Anaerosphaera aminiphila DSM 21120]|uniref:Pyruvate oxidase n=1 Tax=Anaerosphaera aminiphila DSM 21120 TaxID=1120995 RepID=A0A1M5TL46_9FIRM|nr:thiamine pyrophosphate-binding protein [Anaerosphaera aminiphila]SHH51434.1 pyruvate oxidase [Anaerosphaera aminiphila DSM 21120]